MITVEIGRTRFHCETPEEAFRIHQLATGQQPTVIEPSVRRLARHNGRSTAREFLEKLKAYEGKELDATEMVALLGVDSPQGIGTKLRHLNKSLSSEGVALDDYVVSRRASDGTKWAIRAPVANG